MRISTIHAGLRAAFAHNKANTADTNKNKNTARALAVLGLVVLAAMPELAMAAPWDSVANQVLAIFNSGLTRTIAIIAVIACGIAAMAGKLSWEWGIKIIIGIVMIFGAAGIVDYVISAAAS
jgi:type IV secretion system protein VirB2